MSDLILIRYGELALKGKNRSAFENRLLQNIRDQLGDFPEAKVSKSFGRIFVMPGFHPRNEVMAAIKDVFGVVGISPAKRVLSKMDTIKEAAVHLIKEESPIPASFKVVARRAQKDFPYRSDEINRILGGEVLRLVEGIKVDVHQPELELRVEVRGEETYLYGKSFSGPGGLPVGSSGRVMLMLSGGIDSPVAAYLTLKRGASVEAVHFHSYPFTSERAKQKVVDLAQQLTRYANKVRLHVVPFTDVQTEIRAKCKDSYLITIMRRMMVRIAEETARRRQALALVTGESLGQVASQTLESMNAINQVTRMPILRPLVGMDKQEIMEIARKIGTYETSILPYEDCCTVFQPKSPVTRPSISFCEDMEKGLEIDRLVQEAVDGIETIHLRRESTAEEFSSYF